ncbi:MAG: U32 family peptidase [Clostridiales bacterium]|nr:U32 family peptidase [Clostridiales bacterium]
MESLIAGVRCGADAVYLGSERFNARRNAGNFTPEALEEAARYCHVRGVRVYLALNTLMRDDELLQALELAQEAFRTGTDAVIIQDLGLARLLRACVPDLELHASTQMSVTTPEGFRRLEALGFRRAVLPREASRSEIAQIREAVDMELELFVHGAHCMSVSGQCYMSAMLGGRSGNRGLCAQPCRLPFDNGEGQAYALSLKDLSLAGHLEEICELGIDSLKIEGRMKRPEYVAAAVTACRSALAGQENGQERRALEQVFSRSGFTDGYFLDRRGPEMFGVRTREDAAQGGVLKDLARRYHRETPRRAVRFHIRLRAGEPAVLTGTSGTAAFTARSKTCPEPARSAALTEASLEQRLCKTGGTPFFCEGATVSLEPGLAFPAAEINALRRRVLEGLEQKLAHRERPDGSCAIKPPVAAERPHHLHRRTARFACGAQLPNQPAGLERAYLAWQAEVSEFRRLQSLVPQAGIELPRGLFGDLAAVRRKLEAVKAAGITLGMAHSLDAAVLLEECGFTVQGGFGLNAANSHALALLDEMGVQGQTLSPELRLIQMKSLKTRMDTGILAYGHLPLMLTRVAPGGQKSGAGKLRDRKGLEFPVVFNGVCSEVLNGDVLWMADRLEELAGADEMLLYFTVEDQRECARVLEAYNHGGTYAGRLTRGLYDRGVK